MQIRESELPGVGKKFELLTCRNEKLSIIIHDSGRREVYFFDENDHEESIAYTSFDDNEARQLAAIIGGMTYKPKALENVDVAFDNLLIEWFKIEEGSEAANQSIGKLQIRKKYNVNIIAILRKNQTQITTPGPDTQLEINDTVIISGERTAVKNMVQSLFCKKDR